MSADIHGGGEMAPLPVRHFIIDARSDPPRLVAVTFVRRFGSTTVVSDHELTFAAWKSGRIRPPEPGQVLLAAEPAPVAAAEDSFEEAGVRVVLHVVGDPTRRRERGKRLLALAAITRDGDLPVRAAARKWHEQIDGVSRAVLVAVASVALLALGALGGLFLRSNPVDATRAGVADVGAGGAMQQRHDGGAGAGAAGTAGEAGEEGDALEVRVLRANEWTPTAGAERFCNRWGDLVALDAEQVTYVLCGAEKGGRSESVCFDGACRKIDRGSQKSLPLRLCTREGFESQLVGDKKNSPRYVASKKPCSPPPYREK